MARRYDDSDKALVKAALEANNGNVKRTSRETNIPVMTVRDWHKKWQREGLPAEVEEALPAARKQLVQHIERIRDKAFNALEERLDQLRADPALLAKINPKDLATTGAILTDKARLVEGKPTSHTEHTGSDGNLPIEQVRELFAGFAKGIVEGARARDASISSATAGEDSIDGEAEEQAEFFALPVAASI